MALCGGLDLKLSARSFLATLLLLVPGCMRFGFPATDKGSAADTARPQGADQAPLGADISSASDGRTVRPDVTITLERGTIDKRTDLALTPDQPKPNPDRPMVQDRPRPDTWVQVDSSRPDANPNRYRMPITVQNAGAALTNYQLKITAPFSTHMKSDFADVRFTAGDGSTMISFWKESYTASSSAIFWVKTPQVPTGNSTIYMYYGDPNKTDASDGVGTFVFFDDFSGSLDDSKWVSGGDGTGTIAVSGGYLRMQVSSNGADKFWAYVASTSQFVLPMTIESRQRMTAASCCHGFTGSGPVQATTYDAMGMLAKMRMANATVLYDFQVNTTIVNTTTVASDTWNRFTVKVASGASSCTIGSNTYTNAATFTDTANYLKLVVNKWYWSDGVYDWDWVAVRKNAPAEPSITVGPEENT